MPALSLSLSISFGFHNGQLSDGRRGRGGDPARGRPSREAARGRDGEPNHGVQPRPLCRRRRRRALKVHRWRQETGEVSPAAPPRRKLAGGTSLQASLFRRLDKPASLVYGFALGSSRCLTVSSLGLCLDVLTVFGAKRRVRLSRLLAKQKEAGDRGERGGESGSSADSSETVNIGLWGGYFGYTGKVGLLLCCL